MHTSEHEHIRRVKREEFLFYFFFILPVSISSTARFLGNHFTVRVFRHSSTNHEWLSLPVFADDGLFGLSSPIWRTVRHHPDPFLNLRSSCVPAGVYAFRPFYRLHCLNGRSKKLYALYASKNRLCMLCENITPKKTAYNAYRNENRRVRRAERL